jgi:polyphosphate kinase
MSNDDLPTAHDTSGDGPSGQYFNRELSWLEFNRRVLEEAMDQRHPLLERVKFLAIFSSNLDEFFMIRVAGIRQQIAAGVTSRTADGLLPGEQLSAIRHGVAPLIAQQRACWSDDIQPRLRREGIFVLDYDELDPQQRQACRDYFTREVFPVLTPLAFDPAHPFPHISNLSLNLAVVIRDPEQGEVFARIKVPGVLPRLVTVPTSATADAERIPVERRHSVVWLEQIIAHNLEALFPGEEVLQSHVFRITRNADVEIQEEEAADLLRTIEAGVRQRRFGNVVRLVVNHAMPQSLRDLLVVNLKLHIDDVYEVHGPLGLSSVMSLLRLPRPDLQDPPHYPVRPLALRHARSAGEYFAAIRQQDVLLHHPFDSFQPLVELIEAAAEDPDVLAIKQTLYRVGSNSPIVKALMRAREQDKQVTVLVELKARFDEENNITWARALERAGVHVVYGLVGLKTHAKLALIVRREHDGLRRYVHVGTGNYNATTARIYTDLGVLTCDPDVGADVSDLFNFLTGYSRQRDYRRLLVAPVSLRSGLARLIEREIEHARAGRGGKVTFKFNSLVDPAMTDLLYRASQSGVDVALNVRGICCLRPGVPGLSERITVRSIIGRYLEHSRIYAFDNAGEPEIFIGSADLMQRNLDRRVEALIPLRDPALVAHVRRLLDVYQRDTERARELRSDGRYERVAQREHAERLDSHEYIAYASGTGSR